MPNLKPKPKTTKPTAAKKTQTTQPKAVLSRRPKLPEEVILVLLEVAKNTRKNAYTPYSGYNVGSALLASSGNVYGGCNVENASFGMSICAERTAYVKAISEGEEEFVAIAVMTDDGGTPCGACRQFMAEFGLDTTVVLADKRGKYTLHTVGSLLPNAFVLK